MLNVNMSILYSCNNLYDSELLLILFILFMFILLVISIINYIYYSNSSKDDINIIEKKEKNEEQYNYTDLAITTIKDDKFSRFNIVNSLVNILTNKQTFTTSFVVGLNGKWGSGKSSIINLVKEQIEEKNKEKDSKDIVITFEPWLCNSTQQMVEQFLTLLLNNKELSGDIDTKKIFIRYFLLLTKTINSITYNNESINDLIKLYEENLKNKDNNIQYQKTLIEQELGKILKNRKLVIIIDDIDRLHHNEIVYIFQLVKSLANFRNTVYLLSFDLDIVAKALNDVQKCDGKEYLEKIIQLLVNIPIMQKEILFNIFMNKLQKIFVTRQQK